MKLLTTSKEIKIAGRVLFYVTIQRVHSLACALGRDSLHHFPYLNVLYIIISVVLHFF